MSRTHYAVKNIASGLISQILGMVLGFVSRTIFIKYLAVEYLGINSLFSSILMMLSLAELGLGSAFTYSLYKPLADKDQKTISGILNYFKKIYSFIGIVIFVTGLALLPFLEQITGPKPAGITENIRVIYIIFLFNTASSYFFSSRFTLLNADQQNAVVTVNQMKFTILQNILQICALVVFRNYLAFLLVQTVIGFLSNLYISKIVDRKYPFLLSFKKERIDKDIKSLLLKNTKSSFLVRIAVVIINGTDNLFISHFVGLAVLGKFSNYLLLVNLVSGVTAIIFANLSGGIANLIVTESRETHIRSFYSLNFLNFWIFGLCGIMLIFLTNDFVRLWVGSNYQLHQSIVLIMTINFFLVGMQSTFWTFKSAFGFFKQGQYLVLIAAAINLVLSYAGGMFWGIFGILAATTISRLVTNTWYDPFIVLKEGLKVNPKDYLYRFLKYLVVLGFVYAALYFIGKYLVVSNWYILILKTVVAFVTCNLMIIVFFRKSKEFKEAMKKLSGAFNIAKSFVHIFRK